MNLNRYAGGKNGSGTYQQIINYIPEHKFYFELFVGSGAIYKNKLPAPISFLADKNYRLIETWKTQILPGATIIKNIDSILFLEHSMDLLNILHDTSGPLFMYLDPPYPFFTRRSNTNIYKHELTNHDHERILNACSIAKFPVMISSYQNELYSGILKNWYTHCYESMTRTGIATECLYMNYPKPEKLHDYRYIGDTFREREKFKLSQHNVLSKFDRMPAALRNSILTDLTRKYGL